MPISLSVSRPIVHTVWAQQDVHDADCHDTVLIPFGHDAVLDHDNFLERAVDVCQRICLQSYLRLVRQGKGRPDVIALAVLIGHEVYFIQPAYRLVLSKNDRYVTFFTCASLAVILRLYRPYLPYSKPCLRLTSSRIAVSTKGDTGIFAGRKCDE